MIYKGDDEILRSICLKIEKALRNHKFIVNLPSITYIHYLRDRLFIYGIPWSINIWLTNKEKTYMRDNGSVTILTNKNIFEDELGWGYFDNDGKDDVYRRFPTKEQANREYYEYMKGIDKKYHNFDGTGTYREEIK